MASEATCICQEAFEYYRLHGHTYGSCLNLAAPLSLLLVYARRIPFRAWWMMDTGLIGSSALPSAAPPLADDCSSSKLVREMGSKASDSSVRGARGVLAQAPTFAPVALHAVAVGAP